MAELGIQITDGDLELRSRPGGVEFCGVKPIDVAIRKLAPGFVHLVSEIGGSGQARAARGAPLGEFERNRGRIRRCEVPSVIEPQAETEVAARGLYVQAIVPDAPVVVD
jgi:hypothetical protein